MKNRELPMPGDKFFSVVMSNAEDLHSHESFEITFITSGSAKLNVDGKKQQLLKGDGVIFAPNTKHGFSKGDADFLRREIYIPQDCLFAFLHNVFENDYYTEKVTSSPFIAFKLSHEEIDFIESKFHLFYSYPEKYAVNGFINMIVSLVAGCIVFRPKNSPVVSDDFSRKCLRLCQSHFAENDAAETVRKTFDYNDVYFGRKFKECFGCSLAEYVAKLRMERAAYNIINSSLTIEEISNSVGIFSIAYFIKLFKKTFGETPSKFRASKKEKIIKSKNN